MAFSFGSGAGAGGSLFGAKPQAAQSAGQPQSQQPSFSFGAQPQGQAGQGARTPHGSLFGQPQAAQGTLTSQPQGSLFGQSHGGQGSAAPSQPQGSLFGQSQPQGGLFGQPQPANTQSAPSTTFGSAQQPAQTSLFGASKAPQPGGLFGASQSGSAPPNVLPNAAQPSGGTFGSAPGKEGGASFGFAVAPDTSLQGPSAQPQDKKLGMPLNLQLERIRSGWDTKDLSTCQFQFYFYNRAADAQALQQLSVRRADAVGPMHEALWMRAMSENPDPQRLYPVLAVGYGDIETRANAQSQEAVRQRAKAAELSKQLSSLRQKHDLSNTVRAQWAVLQQARIHQRLLSLLKYSYLLIPALRGQPLTGDEDRLVSILENCEAQLNGAAGEYSAPLGQHMRLRARMNELWAQLGVVRAQREAARNQGRSDNGSTEWAVVDETGFDEIAAILGAQQRGLLHLADTLSGDSRALETICEGLSGVPLVGVRGR